MQEDGSYVRIYSAEGELIGNVADDNSYAVQGAGALGQGKDGKVYAAALATENVTAEDDPVTLVSVDPERLCFLPVQGDAAENAKAVQSTGTIYQWNMVAAGVSDGSDFILWGYSGVDTYRLEDAEFTRAQEVWEMPCGTEGTCAVIVPDGRILYMEPQAVCRDRRQPAWTSPEKTRYSGGFSVKESKSSKKRGLDTKRRLT